MKVYRDTGQITNHLVNRSFSPAGAADLADFISSQPVVPSPNMKFTSTALLLTLLPLVTGAGFMGISLTSPDARGLFQDEVSVTRQS